MATLILVGRADFDSCRSCRDTDLERLEGDFKNLLPY